MPAARGRSGASASEPEDSGTVNERQEAVVVNDIHCWMEPHPHQPGMVHYRAYANQHIRVLPEELERGLMLGSLAVPEDAAEVRQAIENAHGPVSDEVLANMAASELIAYVTQNPDEQARVALFEQSRGEQARPEVLQAAGAGEQE